MTCSRLRAYESAGGVNDAVATLAEEAFAALDPAGQLATRRLLVRLSDAAGASDVRRRVPLDELDASDDSRLALATFVDRRLLVVDRDSVEVAHEALLREWPRLRSWMDDDRQGRRLHSRLGDAAQHVAGQRGPVGAVPRHTAGLGAGLGRRA